MGCVQILSRCLPEVVRVLKASDGFADVVFLPLPHTGKPALVIELKYDKTAATAIRQIKNRQYVRALEGYAGEICLVGVNYDKASKKHQCEIERVQV